MYHSHHAANSHTKAHSVCCQVYNGSLQTEYGTCWNVVLAALWYTPFQAFVAACYFIQMEKVHGWALCTECTALDKARLTCVLADT